MIKPNNFFFYIILSFNFHARICFLKTFLCNIKLKLLLLFNNLKLLVLITLILTGNQPDEIFGLNNEAWCS